MYNMALQVQQGLACTVWHEMYKMALKSVYGIVCHGMYCMEWYSMLNMPWHIWHAQHVRNYMVGTVWYGMACTA